MKTEVVIKNPNENKTMILYNIIFSFHDEVFSKRDLIRKLQKYLSLPRKEIKYFVETEISKYIENNLIIKVFDGFKLI